MQMCQYCITVSTLLCHKSATSKEIRGVIYHSAIHPPLESLGSVLRLGYMNDVTLGGSQETVAKDVQTVIRRRTVVSGTWKYDEGAVMFCRMTNYKHLEL